jgi:hypothetical protein
MLLAGAEFAYKSIEIAVDKLLLRQFLKQDRCIKQPGINAMVLIHLSIGKEE